MKSNCLTALCATMATITIAIGTFDIAQAENASNIVAVIEGFRSPESVLIVGDRRFVSNMGSALDPVAEDGDGYISEVSADGRIVAERAFPPANETLNAPKGMATIDGRLYVADIDRVVGFDITSGARVFEQRLPGREPALANDLAATQDGQLLLTDTLRNAVYRLDPQSGAFTQIGSGIPGANGITVDPRNQRILVAGIGENFGGGDLFCLDGTGRAVRLHGSPHGVFDGLAVLTDGRVIVSDWKAVDHPVPGVLLALSNNGAAHAVQIGPEIHGPADFAWDASGDTLWVPATLDNQVVVVRQSR